MCVPIQNIAADFNPLQYQAEALLRAVWESGGNARYVKAYHQAVHEYLYGGITSARATIPEIEAHTLQALKANVWHFAGAQSISQIKDLNRAFNASNGDYNLFRKLTAPITSDYNRNWLKTQYDTATRTAGGIAEVQDAYRTIELFPCVQWIQVQRPTKGLDHVYMHRKIFDLRASRPPTHPTRYGCACYYIKLREPGNDIPITRSDWIDLTKKHGDYAEMVKSGFLRDHTTNQEIFAPKQMMATEERLKKVTVSDKGLKPLEQIPGLHAFGTKHAYLPTTLVSPIAGPVPVKEGLNAKYAGYIMDALTNPTETVSMKAGKKLRHILLFAETIFWVDVVLGELGFVIDGYGKTKDESIRDGLPAR